MAGWPWPLDAVQYWFEGLWDWISTAAINAVKPVADWITNSAAWLWNQITQVGGWLWTRFQDLGTAIQTLTSQVGSTVYGAVISAASAIESGISSTVTWVGTQLSTIGSWITGVIWGWIDGALRWLTDSFKWLQSVIGESADWIVGQLGDVIAGIPTFLTNLSEEIMGGLASTGDWIIDQVGIAFDGAFTAVGDAVGSVFGPIIAPITGFLNLFTGIATAIDTRKIAIMFESGADMLGLSPEVPAVGAPPLAWDEYLKNVEGWANRMDSSVRSFVEVATIIEAVSLGQVDFTILAYLATPKFRAFSSMTEEIYKMEFDASMGIFTKQRLMAKFTPMIPAADDLIRFVVREVIAPEKFYEYMPLQGFSREISEWYWEAHWILPPITQLYDAYHRGVITRDELDKYIVLHDFKPEPRPGITKSDQEIVRSVIKTLIPRVDLRYAWEVGMLTDEELTARYETLGYEEDSEMMAKIQIYRTLTEEVGKVRTEWLTDFMGGFIDESTLRANLEALGIVGTRQDYYVLYAAKRRERDQKKDLLDLYKDGFMKDMITDEELRDRVLEIIVVPEVADLFVEKAYTDKYKKPSPPKAPTEDKALAELQKYQVTYAIQAYRKYAVEKSQLIAMLVAAGVDPDVASTRADYEELKRPVPKPTALEVARAKEQTKAQQLAQQTAIQQFRTYVLDRDQLYKALVDAGLGDVLATATVQLEDLRRPAPPVPAEEIQRRRLEAEVKRLTGATLEAQYSKYAIEKDELIAGLIVAGYDPAEASARADLAEARRPTPKPTAEEVTAAREATRVAKLAEQEALTLFRAEAITSAELTARLEALGYGADLVSAIVRFEEVKLALKKKE